MPSKSQAPSDKFGKRFAEAVRKRTYPNSIIHAKQLAGVAGYSVDTFLRWCRGENRVPGDAVGALVVFFAQAGDWSFISEVLGVDVSARALDARLEKLDRELAELRSDLKGNGDAGLARARETVALDGAGRICGEAGEGPARQEEAPAELTLAGGARR